MNIPSVATAFTLCATLLATGALSATDEPAATKEVAVTLRYGKETPPTAESAELLHQKAVALVATSSFNSRGPRWFGKPSDTLEGYRATMSGKYLLVTFNEPREISTHGGVVSVREIVIGLSRNDYASSLYTIDDELRIVGHEKYSGHLCVELMNTVKQLSGDTEQSDATASP
jgi:hypothetical protein